MRVLALHAEQAEVLVASRARLHSSARRVRHHLPSKASVRHPGPCPRPSHTWFAHSFAPFCAACRALAEWLDRARKARR